jgi:hypothetical protein
MIHHIEHVVYVHAVSLTFHVYKMENDYHCFPINDLLTEVMEFISVRIYEPKCTTWSAAWPKVSYYPIIKTVVFIGVSLILFPC